MSESRSDTRIGVDKIQQLITRGPFNQWLDFTVVKADADGLEVRAKWREEWVVNPDRRYTHGGILAAIVDVAADYAIAAELARNVERRETDHGNRARFRIRLEHLRRKQPINVRHVYVH